MATQLSHTVIRSKNAYIKSSSGKRKTALARVHLKLGTGQFIINKRTLPEYFVNEIHKMAVLKPFKEVELENQFDVYVRVKGGGVSGQSIAIQYGIVRALIKLERSIGEDAYSIDALDELVRTEIDYNIEDSERIKRKLRAAKLVTQDSRIVERKKCGRRKARKGEQYSKR